MTAKEYLKQIQKIDLSISQKEKELECLTKRRVLIGGMDYSSERVQTSSDGNGFTRMSDRLVDLQNEINTEIDKFYQTRHEIINQIQQMTKTEYIDLLFKRYIEYESFESIASEMGLSYYRTCHLHGEALTEFDDKFLKVSN